MTFARRRQRLLEAVGRPILLSGVGEAVRNLPMNKLPFRQDSSLLWATGCDLPGCAALIHEGGFDLFVVPPADDDALWHGVTTTLEELRLRYGADRVAPIDDLEAHVRATRPATLAVADPQVNARVSGWLGLPLSFGEHHGHEALVDAIIAARRVKDADEIAEMVRVAEVTERAFRRVMAATRPGSHERSLAALFHASLEMEGHTTGYSLILTQSGEVLHNHSHAQPLESGRLVLLDGGGEGPSGYGVDITRAWPVSGRFSPRQRSAYEAVLASQRAAIAACTPGRNYREVHDVASHVLATWLRDEGLLRISADHAVETGAHAVFFPHGVGHHLGLDVHDLENFGDRPSYPPGVGRPEPFGTRYLRLSLPLEVGWVVTVEPGFYVAPAILADRALRERFAHAVDFERAASWVGFGGIRIEDDVHVTADGPRVLTGVPKEIAAIEALVGSGPTMEERLG